MTKSVLCFAGLLSMLCCGVAGAQTNANDAAPVSTNPVVAPAFTAQDAATAFDAYQKTFYVVTNGKGYYKEFENKGRNHFWTQAEEIEMVLDVYGRTKAPEHLKVVAELIAGFGDHFGTNWLANKYNDDLLWMVIATARAYLVTSNATYLSLAKFHFDETFSRAWSTNLGGGLWWTTNNTSKNACVNGPGAIAACYLYQILKDPLYLDKAQNIHAWNRQKLFDPETGAVRDNMRADGRISRQVFTYNLGTFIGSANFLAQYTGDKTHLKHAELAADHARDRVSKDGLLPAYNFSDGNGFNSILVRWLGRFASDNHVWHKYHTWMLNNANTAWKNRRADNLSWNRLQLPTPPEPLRAWACADAIVLLHVVPRELP
jgi:predicted alpha-1,6-mannanase (GH76 family)